MGWSVGRLILDPYSIALYSSKGEDFGKIKALQDQGHTLADAIEIVAKDIARKK
jgi:conjugal transfer ATP-binding protein TraC